MFNKWKSSVISLFNGAVDSSAIVLLFFKVRLQLIQTSKLFSNMIQTIIKFKKIYSSPWIVPDPHYYAYGITIELGRRNF
jgi:hypothetical protein